MKQELNRPTEAGRRAGRELARLFEDALPAVLEKFPGHEMPCASCAYRRDTIPNGCEETVMDAIKAAAERVPFYCHMDIPKDGIPTQMCAGWAILQSTSPDGVKAPWPWSHEITVCDVDEAATGE